MFTSSPGWHLHSSPPGPEGDQSHGFPAEIPLKQRQQHSSKAEAGSPATVAQQPTLAAALGIKPLESRRVTCPRLPCQSLTGLMPAMQCSCASSSSHCHMCRHSHLTSPGTWLRVCLVPILSQALGSKKKNKIILHKITIQKV